VGGRARTALPSARPRRGRCHRARGAEEGHAAAGGAGARVGAVGEPGDGGRGVRPARGGRAHRAATWERHVRARSRRHRPPCGARGVGAGAPPRRPRRDRWRPDRPVHLGALGRDGAPRRRGHERRPRRHGLRPVGPALRCGARSPTTSPAGACPRPRHRWW
jgi:hypothetical protein